MNARNLALEALRQLDSSLQFTDWENGEGEEVGAQLRAAAAALEAETGEPVAWIDPRDLAVLTCPGVKEFGPMRYAGVSGAQNSKATTPLYTAPPSAVPPGWKLVPIEPTPEMWKAGLAHLFRDVDAVWRAMLAEVPEAPK